MRFERWRTVAEVSGLAAVAAFLVFVGIQIKQTQEIARATMRLQLTTTSQEVIFGLIE